MEEIRTTFASGLPDIAGLVFKIADLMSAIKGGLLGTLGNFVGSFFVFQGLVRAYRMANNRFGRWDNDALNSVFMPIFWGVVLIHFWASQQMLSDYFELNGGALSPPESSSYLKTVWSALMGILHAFGAIAIFRGFLLAKAAADGTAQGHKSPAWGAFWHVLGGVLLMGM